MKTGNSSMPAKTESSVVELHRDNTEQFVTFYFGQHFFGLPIDDVIEINMALEITPVPLAPSYVAGVVKLRGQILTAVNLALKVDLALHNTEKLPEESNEESNEELPGEPDRLKASDQKFNNVIMGNREEPVSLLVERIGDVMSVPGNQIESPPDLIEGVNRQYVSRVCKLKDRLLIILDSSAMEKPESSNEHQI